jgi:hypothetical protein
MRLLHLASIQPTWATPIGGPARSDPPALLSYQPHNPVLEALLWGLLSRAGWCNLVITFAKVAAKLAELRHLKAPASRTAPQYPIWNTESWFFQFYVFILDGNSKV